MDKMEELSQGQILARTSRSAGEGIGYPLQDSWASPVAQLVKNPPAMWETWVQSLCWEDSLEKGKVTHSSILAWRIPWTVQPMGNKESDTTEDFITFTFITYLLSFIRFLIHLDF